MNNKWKLGFFGLIAGILSFFAVTNVPWGENIALSLSGFYSPGEIFGIVTASYFIVFSKRDWTFWYKAPGWILTSSIAYYVAVQVALGTMDMFSQSGGGFWSLYWLGENYTAPPPLSMILAGCVGVFILLIGFYLFWSSVTWRQWCALTLLGGLLALSFFLPALITKFWESGSGPYFTLFVVWQTGMAFGFGYILDQKNKVNKAPV